MRRRGAPPGWGRSLGHPDAPKSHLGRSWEQLEGNFGEDRATWPNLGATWVLHEPTWDQLRAPGGIKNNQNAVLSTISGFLAQRDFGAVRNAPRGAREGPRAPRGPPRRAPRATRSCPGASKESLRAAQERPRRRPRDPKGAKRAQMGPRRVQNGSPEGPRSVQSEDRRGDKGDDVPKGEYYPTRFCKTDKRSSETAMPEVT